MIQWWSNQFRNKIYSIASGITIIKNIIPK